MKSWKEAFHEENIDRLNTNADDLCTYGITPLDDALFRIARNELVVIGADSGVGKSEMGLSIARHNAKNGKRVAVYYLEGGHKEAIARIKWRDIADEYYRHYLGAHVDMDFRKWVFNYKQPQLLHDLEAQIYGDYDVKYKDNLFFYPVTETFNIELLLTSLLDFHTFEFDEDKKDFDLDLVVIDHLQYFSLDKDENEISEITRILRAVKTITEEYHIPVVLISHLRKKTKDRGLPGQEDFYGSSNIPKISTTSITLTPASDKDNLAEGVYPTYIRIVKNRVGIRPNHAILVDFLADKRAYSDEYQLYRVDGHGNVSEQPLSEIELPKWARKDKNASA